MRTAGLWLRLGEPGQLDESANTRIQGLAAWLEESRPAGVVDAVPGYAALFVEYVPALVSGAVLERRLLLADSRGREPRLVEIPVRYDGVDLQAAASATGFEESELVRFHTADSYHVFSTSFSPGMPLAGSLDRRLHLPRLPAARKSVPAGSVAVAGAQTGVYTVQGPGGWNLLGTALVNLYDPGRAEPFMVRPLDRVRFVASEGRAPDPPGRLELLPEEPSQPCFTVLQPGLLDLVLDRGRRWAAISGLSRSGPVDTRASAIANALLGNDPAAPLLEMNLSGPLLEVSGTVVVAVTGDALQPVVNGSDVAGWSSFALRWGDTLSFRPTGRGARSYLALAGGIEADSFLASCSTDLRSLLGRPLAAGDRLGVAAESQAVPGRSFRPFARQGNSVVLGVRRGPQFTAEAADALGRQEFTVASADRMGVRLGGASVPGGEVVSEPVPLGSVQVAAGGEPMILLADRGQVGGYAKPVVLDPASLPAAAQLVTGMRVRFRLAE